MRDPTQKKYAFWPGKIAEWIEWSEFFFFFSNLGLKKVDQIKKRYPMKGSRNPWPPPFLRPFGVNTDKDTIGWMIGFQWKAMMEDVTNVYT